MNRLLIAMCLMALTLTSLGASDQRARVLLQAAEAKVKLEGDLNGAIKIYREAEKEAGGNRALVAQALVKMAEAYRALGDRESQKIYQRLVAEFSDQKDAVAIARSRLEPKPNTIAGATLKDVANLNASGNVTADGRYATFVNWDTGNIAVRDLFTGATREITKRASYDVYDPAISRDGRFVAFQSFNHCVEQTFIPPVKGVLCVLPVEGEPTNAAKTVVDRTDLRNIRPLDWSPDGRSIAVTLHRLDGTSQIGIVRVADGSLTVLQTTDWRGATRIFFSPDGRYVAFDVPVDDSSDQLDIRVVAVDGSEGSTAIHDPSQNVVMGWTPDGRNVLFASDRGGSMSLWAQRVTNAKADGASRLVHPGLGGAWSLGLTRAGSLYFGVQRGDRDVEVLTLDLKAGKTLAPPARPIARYVGTNRTPAWSHDGKFLAYVSQRGIAGTGRIIGIRDSSSGAVRELRPQLTYMEALSWAPDGNTLVTNGTDLKGRSGVFTIDVRTGGMTLLGPGRFPQFSPDGTRILFVTPGSAPPNSLVERTLTTGAERTIIAGEFATFTVSPDGRSFAIARGSLPNATEVVIVAADSGEVRQVYRVPQGERVPSYVGMPFTPDGTGILMRKRVPEELWFVPTDGGQARKVDAPIAGWTFGTIGSPSLHPDGRQLAGTKARENPSVEVRVLESFLSAIK